MYLALSGIPLPVAQLRYAPTHQGTKGRAFSGFPYSTVRKTLMTYSGTTPPVELSEAWALRQLVNGVGHSWSFDSGTVSSLGVLPTATLGGAASSVGGAKYGTARLVLPLESSVAWPIPVTADSTMAAWVRVPDTNGGAWSHMVWYPGTQSLYLDGALWYADAAELQSERGLAIQEAGFDMYLGYTAEGTGAQAEVDDVLLLPYVAPLAWMDAVRAAGAPFGPLPYHRATGTGLHRPVTVLGDAKDGDSLEWWTPAGERVAGESFSLELMEQP